jgi:hypothetical protein
MFTATLPVRKSSKNSTVDFVPCLNDYTRVAGVATITTDRATCAYVIEESPDDMPGVRVFVLSKMGNEGTDDTASFYHVRTRPEYIGVFESAGACSCKGFGYKLTCKHVDAVHALVTAGKL